MGYLISAAWGVGAVIVIGVILVKSGAWDWIKEKVQGIGWKR